MLALRASISEVFPLTPAQSGCAACCSKGSCMRSNAGQAGGTGVRLGKGSWPSARPGRPAIRHSGHNKNLRFTSQSSIFYIFRTTPIMRKKSKFELSIYKQIKLDVSLLNYR